MAARGVSPSVCLSGKGMRPTGAPPEEEKEQEPIRRIPLANARNVFFAGKWWKCSSSSSDKARGLRNFAKEEERGGGGGITLSSILSETMGLTLMIYLLLYVILIGHRGMFYQSLPAEGSLRHSTRIHRGTPSE